MKKIIVLILSCVIVLLSFVFCFADGSPVILPVASSDSLNVGFKGYNAFYRTNKSPVYFVYYKINDQPYYLVFSDTPGAVLYLNEFNKTNVTSHPLNSVYNGYYYNSVSLVGFGDYSNYIVVDGASSATDIIDYIDNTVFSTTFDLTYIVNGSVSWLSTFAQAVKNSPLLLFFVIFIFVGIGISLLNRFARR